MFRRVSASVIVAGSPLLCRLTHLFPNSNGNGNGNGNSNSSPVGSPLLSGCVSPGLTATAAASLSPASFSSFGSPLLCSRAHQSSSSSPPPTGGGDASTTAEVAPKKRGRKSSPKKAAAPRPTTEAAHALLNPNTTTTTTDTTAAAAAAQLVRPPLADEAEIIMDDIATSDIAVAQKPPAPKRKRAKRQSKKDATAATTATATTAEADALGDPSLDELSFFADMEDSLSPRTFEESTLVYNPLTGRMTSEAALATHQLGEIGFGVNKDRQLWLERPAAFNRLAERVRAGTTSLPAKWPKTMAAVVGGILANKALADPAVALQQMMQVKINSVTRSRHASVVTASGGDPAAQAAEGQDAFNLMGDEGDATGAIKLNPEQDRVIDLALQGRHMYIGGSAGTGKTVLLRVLSRRLQANRLRVAMTATTGVAGCHIGGSTFHHAMGVSSNGEFLRRSTILDHDVIIIDEVSMFPLRLFEDFDRVLREEAGTPDLPFGGVQIILCGDFLQLGCINEQSVIHSKLFQDTFVKLRLETIVRQSAHIKFAQDLQLMRRGLVPDDLTETVQQLPAGTMVESAVNLLPTNKEVHAANQQELDRLEGDPLTLTPEHGITSLKCDATATLLLRTRADFNEHEFSQHIRSLLQATLDLPRASLLSLYRVYEDGHAMRVILPPGESVAWREAMRERFLEVAGLINDLELGATVTEIVPNGDGLHTPDNEEQLLKLMAKHPIAQPLTFKKGCRILLRANLSSNLVNGSIGTVVDFIECTENNFPVYLRNENVNECIERYRVFCLTECGMPIPMVPVVKFHSGETVAVPPWEFRVGGTPTTNYFSLSTVALPLSLAYAFTVHKVQGLTLVGRVHLELSRMWPCEHLLYVAMSRVKNPEQLSMSSFSPNMVVANEDCVAFDNVLRGTLAIRDDELHSYPVSAWKRCNDTIYHLRRRGSSLRKLLEEVALANKNIISNNQQQQQRINRTSSPSLSGHGNGSNSNYNTNNTNGIHNGQSSSNDSNSNGALLGHLASVEQSVLVARRMRKLVKHVERVSRLSDARKKAKNAAAQAAAAAAVKATATAATAMVAAETVALDGSITDEHSL